MGDSFWKLNNPFDLYLPLIAIQLSLMISINHILMFILRLLHQPRFVAKVIAAGIILGPTLIQTVNVSDKIFTFEDNYVVENFANLGLTYYMFLVGLEMDVSALRHIGKKSLSISFVGNLVPLVAGGGLYFVPIRGVAGGVGESLPMGAMFWAISLSNSSFPDLARILSNVKLLHTDLGRLALTSAFVSAWIFLVITINFYDLHKFYMAAIPTTIFLLACWFLLRPAAVAICGFIADACGAHSMIGGFMLGLIIPHGDTAVDIMERIQGFVNQVMLPTFFLLNGRRSNLISLALSTRSINLLLVTIGASSSNIISTLLICLFQGVPSTEALALGGLLNTKGVLSLIVLNEGRSMKALIENNLTAGYRQCSIRCNGVHNIVNGVYKQRTMQRNDPNKKLRILTCIHSTRNLSGIINLLQLSNATRRSPICVFAVHLVQLTGTGSASAMLIVQDSQKTSTIIRNSKNKNYSPLLRAESDQIINAFENFERANEAAVTMHPLTVVSPYSTMHEDIFQIAEDRHVAFILAPYHKLPTADGRLRNDNVSIRQLNQNLLNSAPCSIGILVDRGVGPSIQGNSTEFDKSKFRIAMFFIGRPDDHEALSYATRMAEKSGVTLTVVRFLQAKEENTENDQSSEDITESTDKVSEIDDDFINEFRFKTMCEEHLSYQEKTVNSGDELMECASSNYNKNDLYIVGFRDGVKSKITRELSNLSTSPELGAIGETLVTTRATERASVLVMQQSAIDQLRTGSRRHKAQYGKMIWASPVLNPDYEAYARTYNL
ncbi:LOW QUALITY PROTEIN: cation/H(+) antiporter 15-like [Pistacia vera]|uniref:LOW QUALITY PROTEIN: cation/H(+) antiporter 15-like n=1 Tax=Pistacia vera TaxID=55513 RepID=UPI0012634948|nr:LOW QUALITY PROTEIN: cation/H(+) antiporter 15-like [Pistacia vera]